jgi:uncharacterized protein HemX
MDRPLSARAFFWTVGVCAFVALVLAGYVWTVHISKMEDLDTKLNKLHREIDNIGVCQKAKAEAVTNQSRISDLESQLDDAAQVIQACKEELSP